MNLFEISVYNRDVLVSKIECGDSYVSFINYIDDALLLPFGTHTRADKGDLHRFLESRCFPRERANCSEILSKLGVPYYDAELICRATHGVQNDDYIWLQFSDEEPVCFDEVKLRN